MLFNSIEFLIFLPIVFLLHYLLPHKLRWILLLAASYIFYMAWEWKYISLILVSTLIDYSVARKMESESRSGPRKLLLLISMITNLGILVIFKYANFFIDNVNLVFENVGMNYLIPYTGLLLPMGISFYTFQTMAYTIDVYRGQAKVERHFGYFALYVSYFPQLVAGPIERAQNLIDQLKAKTSIRSENLILGSKMMIWGLFKKMVVADRLGAFVTGVYDGPHDPSGILVIVATLFFALQIYCDFSGYSDIAIGVARIFGVRLMDNFRTPYLSKNISEFWSRWHISLSTWFRDYLYIPLGGNRVNKSRWLMNIMLVFLISGFWHGANWTFIVWGGLHGAYLLSERFLKLKIPLLSIQRSFTFLLVCLAWLFFRAADIGTAGDLLAEISNPGVQNASYFIKAFGVSQFAFLSLIGILFMFFDPLIDKRHKSEAGLKKSDGLVYGAMVAMTLLFGNFGEVSFIYFQF